MKLTIPVQWFDCFKFVCMCLSGPYAYTILFSSCIRCPTPLITSRYTYTDSTGFKLNFNYNAGTKVTPGYDYNQPASVPAYNRQQSPAPAPARDSGRQEYYDAGQQRRTRPPSSGRNDIYGSYDYPA